MPLSKFGICLKHYGEDKDLSLDSDKDDPEFLLEECFLLFSISSSKVVVTFIPSIQLPPPAFLDIGV
jgi:hypothetical protein